MLTLGSLSSIVDWGWAPDYVDAMTRILRHDEPQEFVVATGEKHTVADFVACTFGLAGISDWPRYVREERSRVDTDRKPLVGDATRLRGKTGWQPSMRFEEMVEALWSAAIAKT